jgi:RimJ/RimL family protein N-acetyltransferase
MNKNDTNLLRDLSKVTIRSGRLILKPVSLDYDDMIFREYNDNVTKYLQHGPNESLKCVNDFLLNEMTLAREGKQLTTAVISKNGEFLGLAGLKESHTKTPEFGLWLKETAQGKGYGTEVIFALHDWASRNLDLESLKYRAFQKNPGSWKIAEKLVQEFGGEYLGEEPEMVRGQNQILKVYKVWPKKA